jgi:hypothetical protein
MSRIPGFDISIYLGDAIMNWINLTTNIKWAVIKTIYKIYGVV